MGFSGAVTAVPVENGEKKDWDKKDWNNKFHDWNKKVHNKHQKVHKCHNGNNNDVMTLA